MNLETSYLGFQLRTPLVVSASPLTGDFDNLRRLEDAGASAIVLPSVFEEQIQHRFNDSSWSLTHGIEPYPSSLSYLPDEEDFLTDPEGHLDRINKASRALSIPVIASISGATPGDWIQFAKRMEAAGADAIELSIYHVPTDFAIESSKIEQSYVQIVAEVRKQISIPLAVKLSPFFTNFPHIAHKIVGSGADGLVLFNRPFNIDINLEHVEFVHTIHRTASRDLELPLRWIALLRGRLQVSFAATSGVHTGVDALKLLFVGADVTMMCSALMIRGIEHLKTVETEMKEWLETHGHISLHQVRGCMSMERRPECSTFERANYIWAVGDFTENIKREVR